MQTQLLQILESEASRQPHRLSGLNVPLAATESMVRARVKARLMATLDAQPKRRSLADFIPKPAVWSLAAALICLGVGILLVPRSVKPGHSLATLRFGGIERTIGLEMEALDIQQQFTLMDDQALVIEGQHIRTAPVRLVDGKRMLPVMQGKFVVKFNRDHSQEPMEFLVGNHRIRVVGTIFGVLFDKSLFKIAVSEGKIQITDPKNQGIELETGQSVDLNVNGSMPIRKKAILSPEFQELFASDQKAKEPAVKGNRSHKIPVREIDEHEADELYKSK